MPARHENAATFRSAQPVRSDAYSAAAAGAPRSAGAMPRRLVVCRGGSRRSPPPIRSSSFPRCPHRLRDASVQAFAGGRQALSCSAREVFDGFLLLIDTCQRNGETLESKFVGIEYSKIVAAELNSPKRANVTVRFISGT